MKKKLIIIIIVLIALVVGLVFGIKEYNKKINNTRKTEFITAVESYYDNYMSNIKGVNSIEVTLEMLNNVVLNNDEVYEINSLKKCDNKSKIVLTIKNNKITNEKVQLICK